MFNQVYHPTLKLPMGGSRAHLSSLRPSAAPDKLNLGTAGALAEPAQARFLEGQVHVRQQVFHPLDQVRDRVPVGRLPQVGQNCPPACSVPHVSRTAVPARVV